ncbi:MAG: alpha/beta hydrolase [Acidobacteriota bacterium]|nr:alpha/beta hydrolase [Acidobacteriota bacterium]
MLDFKHVYIPGADESQGTVLLLHGTGGDERDLLPLGARIAPGAAVLSPRGKVLENGMPRFFRRLAMGVFDVEDLKFRTQELAGFVADAARHYGFDPKRVLALGYSNGANIAASLMLLRPEVLEAAVLLRPMIPLTPEHPPDLAGVRVFAGGGLQDPIVRPEETEGLAEMLRNAGAEVEVHWSRGGHELSAEELEKAREWVALTNRPHAVRGGA